MKVLIPVDGSTYCQYAVRFVARHFAELKDKPEITLYTVVEPLLPHQAAQIGRDGIDDYYKEVAQHALTPAQNLLDEREIPYKTAYNIDWVSDILPIHANENHYDLIVMASRGLTEMKSLLFGSVTIGVLNKTKIPVILVRGENHTGNKTRRIGIAIDDSQSALDVMNYVIKTQAIFGDAQYHLIHVLRDIDERMLQSGAMQNMTVLKPEEKAAVEKVQFDKVLKRIEPTIAGLNGEVVPVKLVGNPAEAIHTYAMQKNLDMVVMGSHGRSSIATAFVGSVVCQLASKDSVPLLIVR